MKKIFIIGFVILTIFLVSCNPNIKLNNEEEVAYEEVYEEAESTIESNLPDELSGEIQRLKFRNDCKDYNGNTVILNELESIKVTERIDKINEKLRYYYGKTIKDVNFDQITLIDDIDGSTKDFSINMLLNFVYDFQKNKVHTTLEGYEMIIGFLQEGKTQFNTKNRPYLNPKEWGKRSLEVRNSFHVTDTSDVERIMEEEGFFATARKRFGAVCDDNEEIADTPEENAPISQVNTLTTTNKKNYLPKKTIIKEASKVNLDNFNKIFKNSNIGNQLPDTTSIKIRVYITDLNDYKDFFLSKNGFSNYLNQETDMNFEIWQSTFLEMLSNNDFCILKEKLYRYEVRSSLGVLKYNKLRNYCG